MSHDDVSAFLRRLAEDPALRGEVEIADKTCDEQILALVLLGAKHGYEFTPAHVKEVLDAVMAAGRPEDEGVARESGDEGDPVRAGIRLTLDPCLGRLEYLGRPCRERLRTPSGESRTRSDVSDRTT